MVLMLTAAGAPVDRVAGLGIGADDYLSKPFTSTSSCCGSVASLVVSPTRVAAPLPQGRHRTRSVSQRTATRDGQLLDLSIKEFGVLEALTQRSPAFSAEELLEQVWDEHADPFTKTVYVTISRLRRKLGNPDIIETIAKVGYRIASEPNVTQQVGEMT